MRKGVLSFLIIFSLFAGAEELPQPLPDDSYPPTDPGNPPREVEIPYTIGSGDTDRFSDKTYNFYPRLDLARVVRLRLVGLNNPIEIKEVKILYVDSRDERNELTLTGELKPGQAVQAFLEGRRIFRIQVTAIASVFWKKPGGYRVDIIAVR